MIYLIDDNSFFSGADALNSTVTDSEHQTLVKLPEGTYLPAKFDFENQKWIGSDRPVSFDTTIPTAWQTFNASLLLQVATLTSKMAKLEGSASNG